MALARPCPSHRLIQESGTAVAVSIGRKDCFTRLPNAHRNSPRAFAVTYCHNERPRFEIESGLAA
eukprot:8319486-Pyramimonas_sp.AAC.1